MKVKLVRDRSLRIGIRQLVEHGVPMRHALTEFQRQYIEIALEQTGGNRCAAARLIDSHRNTVGRHLPPKRLPGRAHPSAQQEGGAA